MFLLNIRVFHSVGYGMGAPPPSNELFQPPPTIPTEPSHRALPPPQLKIKAPHLKNNPLPRTIET